MAIASLPVARIPPKQSCVDNLNPARRLGGKGVKLRLPAWFGDCSAPAAACACFRRVSSSASSQQPQPRVRSDGFTPKGRITPIAAATQQRIAELEAIEAEMRGNPRRIRRAVRQGARHTTQREVPLARQMANEALRQRQDGE